MSSTSESPNTNVVDTSDPSVQQIFQQVLNNDADWAIFGYRNKNKLRAVDSGRGGIPEITERLSKRPDKLYYIYLRTSSKFVLITWVGEQVPPVKRSKSLKHKKAIQAFLKPIHVEHYASTVEEVSQVSSKIQSDEYLNMSSSSLLSTGAKSKSSMESESDSEEDSTTKSRVQKRSLSSDNLQALNVEISRQYTSARSLSPTKDKNPAEEEKKKKEEQQQKEEMKQKDIRINELLVQVDMQKQQMESLQQELKAEQGKIDAIHESLRSATASSVLVRLAKLKELNNKQKELMDQFYTVVTKSTENMTSSQPPSTENTSTQPPENVSSQPSLTENTSETIPQDHDNY